jgi:AraC-like DNA-binding protein
MPDEPSVADVTPDGCTDLIWQSGHGAYVAGPDTGPVPAPLPPGTIVIGARFRPGAGGAAFGIPLAALRDQRVGLADCLPALARALPGDLPPDIALEVVTSAAAQLASSGPPDHAVMHGARLLAGHGRVAELSAELGISERQLLRRFDTAVGYGPKTLHRVLRFQRVMRQLEAAGPGPDLAELAVRSGYADQAHMTREITRLAGRPPGTLIRQLTPALAGAVPANRG